MTSLAAVDAWPVANAAAAVVRDGEIIDAAGDLDRPFSLASLTKLLTAMAVLVAAEEGTLPLDEHVVDDASTADLLSHAGGISPDEPRPLSAPRSRRIYSTAGYEIVADALAARADMPFVHYLHEAVMMPLSMTATRLTGSPGAESLGTVRDLAALVGAWTTPGIVSSTTLAAATGPVHPELAGVLPGYGRQDPNPWGLGPEIRGDKDPHWTGSGNSPATYGHFGQAGTMLWIDPRADLALVALADEPFGPWAMTAWPVISDAVLDRHRR